VRQAYAVGHLAHCRDSRAQVIFFYRWEGQTLSGWPRTQVRHAHAPTESGYQLSSGAEVLVNMSRMTFKTA
jgi:hypothetical protein